MMNVPGRTILLAEDDDAVRSTLRSILSRNGYSVLEACDGADALRVSREWKGTIRLLLTDVIMPGVDGVRLSEVLKLERPHLNVIYISGGLEGALITRQLPGAAILLKPFGSRELLERVEECFERCDRESDQELISAVASS